MTKKLIAYNYVFPVVGLADQPPKDGMVIVRKVFGTAFSIGGGYYLTASHVIEAVKSRPKWGVGVSNGKTWPMYEIESFECIPDLDIAVIKADLPDTLAMPWRLDEAAMLTPVESCGYPYAFDPTSGTIAVRAFAGTVTSNRTWQQLRAAPRIYELQFMCPRGLSGAPLWSQESGHHVRGVVFGNEIVEMTVFSAEEIEEEGGKRIVYQSKEHLHLGLAIQSAAIVGVHSDLLKGSIGNHLHRNGLVAKLQ